MHLVSALKKNSAAGYASRLHMFLLVFWFVSFIRTGSVQTVGWTGVCSGFDSGEGQTCFFSPQCLDFGSNPFSSTGH
jgi:hypothetical protein